MELFKKVLNCSNLEGLENELTVLYRRLKEDATEEQVDEFESLAMTYEGDSGIAVCEVSSKEDWEKVTEDMNGIKLHFAYDWSSYLIEDYKFLEDNVVIFSYFQFL